MQFRLTDLLWFTAYVAVAAWLYPVVPLPALAIWFGTAFGFEIGKRSDYSTLLLSLCGSVFGMAVFMAIVCTYSLSHAKLFMFSKLDGYAVLLAVFTWAIAGAVFWWLATRLKRRSTPVP